MCDTTEDIDDFIEYELSRDCIEIEGEEEEDGDGGDGGGGEEIIYQDQDYEVVEEIDEDDVNVEIELKPAMTDDDVVVQYAEHCIKGEMADDDDEEEEDDKEVQEVEFDEEVAGEEEEEDEEAEGEEEEEETKPEIKHEFKEQPLPPNKANGPRRYMLFDELVANIVEYDEDGTPIVEFSISGTKADERLPVECGICPDVMHKSKLAKHLKTHLVPGTNRYACIYCDETYKDCKYLAGHARRHMGIRPYVCEICKLYFSTKQDLRVHNQRRHQEKEHICEICGKTFAQNTQLKRHRESTHEKMRRFQCEHCPKSYYKNFSLQEHVRAVHMGKRRMIVCPFCGMQCRDAHKMARHRKQMHLNQSHFECHICNEEFTDINYFDAHKRSIQCRNNTRRKLEEEAQQQQLQLQQQQEQQEQQQQQEEMGEEAQQVQNQRYVDELADDSQQLQLQLQPDQHHQNVAELSHEVLAHKVEVLPIEDMAEGEELVYEITIDSNENN